VGHLNYLLSAIIGAGVQSAARYVPPSDARIVQQYQLATLVGSGRSLAAATRTLGAQRLAASAC
jgi:hypothetical protein